MLATRPAPRNSRGEVAAAAACRIENLSGHENTGQRSSPANFSAARLSRSSRYAICRQAAEQNSLERFGRPARTAPQAAHRRVGA
jgi:hypothetical protein